MMVNVPVITGATSDVKAKAMGDMSKEPSMEEILSSIKRIIAEEGDEAARAVAPKPLRRSRVPAEPEASAESDGIIRGAEVDEVLELTDSFDLVDDASEPESQAEPLSDPEPQQMTSAAHKHSPETRAETPVMAPVGDSMLSVESEVAARHSLSTLSAMLVKPQGHEDNTLEALVRELLRPMMKQWLDANLPDLVEAMVAKEIARITGREL